MKGSSCLHWEQWAPCDLLVSLFILLEFWLSKGSFWRRQQAKGVASICCQQGWWERRKEGSLHGWISLRELSSKQWVWPPIPSQEGGYSLGANPHLWEKVDFLQEQRRIKGKDSGMLGQGGGPSFPVSRLVTLPTKNESGNNGGDDGQRMLTTCKAAGDFSLKEPLQWCSCDYSHLQLGESCEQEVETQRG